MDAGDDRLAVPVVRLDPDLPLPRYAHTGDAGLDLQAREGATLVPGGGRALVPTGIAVAIPAGHAGFVLPRSGLALQEEPREGIIATVTRWDHDDRPYQQIGAMYLLTRENGELGIKVLVELGVAELPRAS